MNNLPWMTEEIKNQILIRDNIVNDKNIAALYQLNDNDDFSIALYEILSNECDYNPEKLNPTQRRLYLCMLIENSGQADHILGFLQEDYSNYAKEVVLSLKEIGAIKSSEIINKAIQLLPEDESWFFDSADENSIKLMNKYDSEFSNYPDGSMRELYRTFAEKNRVDFELISNV